MKPFSILLFVLACTISMLCRSQAPRNGEFELHSNGLIYSPEDMSILGRMVDSLNLRFKTCELDRTHYAFPQSSRWHIKLSGKTNDLKEVQADMKAGKDIKFIREKYASLIYSLGFENTVIKFESKDRKPYYLEGAPSRGYNYADEDEAAVFKKANSWDIKYSVKPDGAYTLECIYQSPVSENKIPDEYARLIQYVDCMIDTNTTIMLGDYETAGSSKMPVAVEKLNNYLNQQMGMKRKKDEYDFYYDYLSIMKVEYGKNNLGKDEHFKKLVEEAVNACINEKNGSEEMEALAEMYFSKNKVLEMKRHRFVMGQCSQDNSPRLHALNIAMLAAQTHSWDIFLRAHLDIMNDHFARLSDGSYAYGRRQTYIKEIEALGLNVTDLLIGLSLRSQNTSDNHYYATVWRLGRALTESKERKAFETRLITMLKNEQLDEFNRGLLFLLYHSYINHLDSDKEQAEKINALKADMAQFPVSLHSSISQMKSGKK